MEVMRENKQYLQNFCQSGTQTRWLLFALEIPVGAVIHFFCCIEHLAFWFLVVFKTLRSKVTWNIPYFYANQWVLWVCWLSAEEREGQITFWNQWHGWHALEVSVLWLKSPNTSSRLMFVLIFVLLLLCLPWHWESSIFLVKVLSVS